MNNPDTGVREEIYTLGNPGKGLVAGDPDGAGPIPAQPEAIRDYEAIELSWNRRFAGNWSARVDLHLQQARGHLFGSRELGRVRPYRPERQPVVRRTAQRVRPERQPGRRARSTPSVRTRSMRSSSIASAGAPRSVSTSTTAAALRSPPSGATSVFRSSRTAAATRAARIDLTQTDLLVTHPFKIGNFTLEASFNVLNLFDEKAALADRQQPVSTATSATPTPATAATTTSSVVVWIRRFSPARRTRST